MERYQCDRCGAETPCVLVLNTSEDNRFCLPTRCPYGEEGITKWEEKNAGEFFIELPRKGQRNTVATQLVLAGYQVRIEDDKVYIKEQ